MKILVTGAAGFIGAALTESLCAEGFEVTGIDNLNTYYDPRLKIMRLRNLGIEFPETTPIAKSIPESGRYRHIAEYPDVPYGEPIKSIGYPGLTFIRLDITSKEALRMLFAENRFDIVVNLAAQAGVRYSITNPEAYVQSNLDGFMNLLECARRFPPRHFIYASSSSVYGANQKVPFNESDRVDSPVSLYAATKKSNELFASVYSSLYTIPCTGLRFFTVYGPWGRPDMAPMLFADAISTASEINVFNNGDMSRDFTYINDIVTGLKAVIEDPTPSGAKIYNIGRGEPVRLMDFISLLEKEFGQKAIKNFLPMQPGDVKTTFADTSALKRDYNYNPSTSLPEGIQAFARWYKDTYLADGND